MPSLAQRFDVLLISTKLANQLIGRKAPGEISYEESEQGDARRRLLYIEKLAAEQKASDDQANAEKLQEVKVELHRRVEEKLKPLFANSTTIAESILGLSDEIANLLDTLSTRACSVSKLEPIVCSLPWLHEAILKEINLPKNRRLDGRGQPIIIESIRTALSSIGIEHLRLMIPHLIFKHSSPQVTDPYPNIKVKFAELSIGVANTMARLSGLLDLRPFEAYLLGTLSELGRCAATRQYFREFDKILNEYSLEAMNAQDQTTYSALQLIQPQPENITSLHNTYANELTIRAFEYLTFKRLNILQPLVNKQHPLNEALLLAQRFTRLKMLIRYRLVEKDEAIKGLAKLKIPTAWLEKLNQPGLFNLDVEYT